MENRLSKPSFCLKLLYREERPCGIHDTRTHWFFLLSLNVQKVPLWLLVQSGCNRVFSHDVTAAILVSQNNETAAMLVSQANPVGVELFSYANVFFCSNKFA